MPTSRASLVAAAGIALAAAAVSPARAQPAAPPAPELAAAAAAQVGTYRCKGHVAVDGDRKRAVTARLVISLDLDGRWLVWRLRQDRTKGVTRPMSYVIFRSWDAAAGTWRSTQLDSVGGRAEQTAADGAAWTGTLVHRGVTVEIRDHQEFTGRALHLWGEYEIETGVFEHGYDVTCRR